MRAAVFFTPAADDPLTRAAAAWLMRDAFAGVALPPVEDGALTGDDIRALTAEPRRYGFHATIKAPFRLAEGITPDGVETALEEFCRDTSAGVIPTVELGQLGPFFAIVPAGPSDFVDALQAKVVAVFDRFRAPPSEAELARRRQTPLTGAQEANLARWGYPYVMEEFRFHMTLTGPVPAARQPEIGAVLRRRFDPLVGGPLAIDSLALFVQREPDADFTVQARFALAGG